MLGPSHLCFLVIGNRVGNIGGCNVCIHNTGVNRDAREGHIEAGPLERTSSLVFLCLFPSMHSKPTGQHTTFFPFYWGERRRTKPRENMYKNQPRCLPRARLKL